MMAKKKTAEDGENLAVEDTAAPNPAAFKPLPSPPADAKPSTFKPLRTAADKKDK